MILTSNATNHTNGIKLTSKNIDKTLIKGITLFSQETSTRYPVLKYLTPLLAISNCKFWFKLYALQCEVSQ